MKVKSNSILFVILIIFATYLISCILHNEEIVNRKILTSTLTTSTAVDLESGNQIVDEPIDNNIKQQ